MKAFVEKLEKIIKFIIGYNIHIFSIAFLEYLYYIKTTYVWMVALRSIRPRLAARVQRPTLPRYRNLTSN